MVKALHAAGIEVILDVVFNHTGEGNEQGRTLSFRGLDNSIYYMLDPQTGAYANYSGCGNTVNCNHPVVRDLILDSLLLLGHRDARRRLPLRPGLDPRPRRQTAKSLANPPLIERIAGDPVLADTKLIAEAWDAAGLYQVGTFPNFGRWAEWNGQFRDDVRRFVRGDAGMVPRLATRLAGSSDLYQDDGRAPVPQHQLRHLPRRLHPAPTWSATSTSTTRPTARTTATAATTTSAATAASKGRPPIRRSTPGAPGRCATSATLLLLSHGVPMLLAGDEMRPHPGRQQQRLVPGQRTRLDRLGRT